MHLPDWNNNGKRDAFDSFVDMTIIDAANKSEESKKDNSNDDEKKVITGISMGGRPLYDATKDSDGMVIVKCFSAVAVMIAGIVIPVQEGMGQLGVIIGIFTGLGIAIAILKNT